MIYIVNFFSLLMNWCYALVPNHWWDIIIFTFITKILTYPISLWCHCNSLKMVALMPKTNAIKCKYFGDSERIGEESAALFKKEHYHPLLSLVPLAIQIVILMGFVKVIYAIAGSEPGSLLAKIPVQDGGIAWIMPLAAGAAAWFLGWCSNHINPLQREQSRAQQITTNAISISISLSLGCFVGMGVGLYWVFSNLFTVVFQFLLNWTVKPSRHVNYAALYASKKELESLEALGRIEVSKEDRRREKKDYKGFFKVANKHLVFYSESSGFYKYYKNIIAWLLEHSNLTIHYVTNDPKDAIFERAKEDSRIRAYYIGPMKIIPLFMKMDADMVIMTTPDLNTYQLKRSYVRKDVKYVYVPHGIASVHLTTREKAHVNFDACLCGGPHQLAEHRATEKYYGTRQKDLPLCGYGLLDDLIAGYECKEKKRNAKPIILIAPSHQTDNIMDSCLDDLIASLYGKGYKIVVRPHPQYKKRYPARLEAIVERFKDKLGDDLVFETDFSSNSNILDADLLVCDWSGIAFEYAFTTLKPVLSINTPMKVINPNYKAIGLPVLDITLRDELGVSVEPKDVKEIDKIVVQLMSTRAAWAEKIRAVRERTVGNLGHFGESAGKYILNTLIESKKGNKK